MNQSDDIVLSHDSLISLHVQLHNQIRHLILAGRWTTGTLIPSESALSAALKVSRTTVRIALHQAELQGLIERFPGKGTFVSREIRKETPSRLIAFVTCGFDSEMHLFLLNGAEDELKASGYRVIFSNVRNHREEIETLQRLQSENAAGILLWPTTSVGALNRKDAESYEQVRLPMVLMDRRLDGDRDDYDFVTSDHYGGACALMEHLIALGHRRIVFLTHRRMELFAVEQRYRAYQDALQAAGLTPAEPWLIGRDGDEISATAAMRASFSEKSAEFLQIRDYILEANPRPTAIFALNDHIAIMALRVLKSLNIKIPDEMSLAGFDDIDLAGQLEVPLTTVAQDGIAIGKRAAQLLLERLEGNIDSGRINTIATQLRIRSSTGISEATD